MVIKHLSVSQPEHLDLVGVANGKPLLLQIRPRQVGDLVICLVLQQGGLELRPVRVLRQLPDVGFAVISHCAHVGGRLWGPGNAVDAVFVVAETHDWDDGFPG